MDTRWKLRQFIEACAAWHDCNDTEQAAELKAEAIDSLDSLHNFLESGGTLPDTRSF